MESIMLKKSYNKAIKYNKKHHWRDWLEKAEDPDIWTAYRYISTPALDRSAKCIPVLKTTQNGVETTAAMNEEKSEMLAKTFFPPRPMISITNMQRQNFLDPICPMDNITHEQITKHLRKLKPYKAPGPDSIPNIVLSKCTDLLIDRLYTIYTVILKLGLYYDPWKQFTTIVL